MNNNVQPWAPSAVATVNIDTISEPSEIVNHAIQLRERDRHQIVQNLEAGYYEIASTFVWARGMALLKKQLSNLGNEFIGELLQRPEIDEYSNILSVVSDAEAITLARDLGIISPLQTIRLMQSQEIVSHFSAVDSGPMNDGNEVMTKEEAISCLRICVQGIFVHESIEVAEDFKIFRNKLETESLSKDSPEVSKLETSPYFFVRTAISVLLSLFRTKHGAALEHTGRNAAIIVPIVWPALKEPEKWQIGQAYAREFSEGRTAAAKGLHNVLMAVAGFDFVPENLRSTSFSEVASKIVSAHQGMNNFYNEPAPMNELAKMGSSIPGPALANCITAVLCVKLGNQYGRSNAAQHSADKVLQKFTIDRWVYYFNERLPVDSLILSKLNSQKPLNNWLKLLSDLNLSIELITNTDVRALIDASLKGNSVRVTSISRRLYKKSMGL